MFIKIKFLPTEIKELIGCDLKNYEPNDGNFHFGYDINGYTYDLRLESDFDTLIEENDSSIQNNWDTFRAAEDKLVQEIVDASEVVQTLVTTFKLEHWGYIDNDIDGNPCAYILLGSGD